MLPATQYKARVHYQEYATHAGVVQAFFSGFDASDTYNNKRAK